MALGIQGHSDAGEVARALANRADIIGPALLGEPTSKSRREMRWGSRGSLAVCIRGSKKGHFYDHEVGAGGDLLDLMARVHNVPLGEAIRIAKQDFLGGTATAPSVRPPARNLDDDASCRVEFAGRIWRETSPLAGTLGEIYFREHRKLTFDGAQFAHVLRWHKGIRAVVGLMTDAVTAEPVGIHRTFLEQDGTKRERRMLGRQGVVRLSPNEFVTTGLGICEGIEDAIAVSLSGWCPIWAATSSGAIARFPVINSVEALTVFADADVPGMQAARNCAARWRAEGREVRIALPREVRP